MREVEQLEISYHKKGWVSVFIGICQSRAQLEAHLEKDYERLGVDDIGCEMGIDFGINTYDEDFSVIAFKKSSQKIDELFQEAAIFDLNELKAIFPEKLDKDYNAVIVLGELKYNGKVKEIVNEQFGYFRFIGSFPAVY